MEKSIVRYLILVITGAAFLTSCTPTPSADEDRNLRMVYTDWSESIAITHLAAVLLEENMEYNVELKLTDVESAYNEVANGTADVFADAWLPETHKGYFNEHAGRIDQIGITFPGARIGFVVPAYSRLNTIQDLKNYQSPVVGIDAGAGVMQKANDAIEHYNLPLRLLS